MSSVGKAFSVVKRKNFLPPDVVSHWWRDVALPIGCDQTISQPYTVRSMLEWLDVQKGDKVLDIGSGSGWTASLLAYLVGSSGEVHAVERVPELLKFGEDNCKKAGIIVSEGGTPGTAKTSSSGKRPRGPLGNVGKVKFYQAGKGLGLSKEAPFDRILVSASAEELPITLLDQLRVGGKLVIPIFNDIHEITKTSETEHDDEIHSGFVFVPLVEN